MQKQIKMMCELEHVNWNVITSNEKTSDEMLSTFYEFIYPLLEKCFPRIKVKLSTRDPSFRSPLVKHLLNLRKKATEKHDFELSNRLQEKINSLVPENQMRTVRQEIIITLDPRNGGKQSIPSRRGPNLIFQSMPKLIQMK